MPIYKYDLLVIGSGPAGEGAAITAAKAGMKVGVVESYSMVGGNCTHKGTIPSKSLRHVVKQIIRFNSNPLFHRAGKALWPSYPEVLKQAEQVIPRQVDMRSEFYVHNRIHLHIGLASFEDANTVNVKTGEGAVEKITADKIVIATGSRPYNPQNVDFSHDRVYDSDSILTMRHTPQTLIIYGAGVIGCEYASIFSGLGVKVDLINSRDRLLSFLDDEISDALSYHLRVGGVTVRHGEEYKAVEATDDGVTMVMESGKRIHADALLWCNGRTGNTDTLALEAIGVEADHRGQLAVNERYETALDNIFAIGDVVGWPSLASASYDQGRSVARYICGENSRFITEAPTGIYTLPEISSIGKTESELTAAKVPYEVGRAFFKDTARAQISGESVGMLKILFHADSLQILGIHCFGAEASEIIHIGQAVMSQEGEANSLKYFVRTTFNYPTMAEAYRVAALDGLHRVNRF
ncbi:Si-specific NAD(P)(+) transhydrogenase [Dasania marina]|uniref:Si-specific NAD(P)(+) transhydrogenase n=1 Tax=Dasania marina TaxID=471499 RepID=UPI00035E40F5|nr:Si-specific NAD(P)(+) transhydrogenase [Dasania marina]|tara:strand:- start:42865 stop:44262 length:1398 start_codon:yes stop_codon:yes gene_type:complete